MVDSVCAAGTPARRFTVSRLLDLAAGRLRIASLVVAAAMVGAGGAAAMTVTTVADSSPTATVEPTDEATDGVTDDATDDATDEATDEDSTDGDDKAAEGDDAAPLDQEACDAAGNHGEYVSFIAHLTKGNPSHGVLVSDAAHSDCGKAAAEETTEGTESDESGDDAKVKKPKKDKSVKSHGKSGQSHGKSGQSHGKGKGRR
jgi:hypothetical protein